MRKNLLCLIILKKKMIFITYWFLNFFLRISSNLNLIDKNLLNKSLISFINPKHKQFCDIKKIEFKYIFKYFKKFYQKKYLWFILN